MGAVGNVFVAWCMLPSRRQKSAVSFRTFAFLWLNYIRLAQAVIYF